MQKKIAGLDQLMLSLLGDDEEKKDMPSRRAMLRMVGNMKAENADEARRTTRIISKIRDKAVQDLVLESDDVSFLLKKFETNAMGLPAWMQGQVLELIENAEKVEPAKA